VLVRVTVGDCVNDGVAVTVGVDEGVAVGVCVMQLPVAAQLASTRSVHPLSQVPPLSAGPHVDPHSQQSFGSGVGVIVLVAVNVGRSVAVNVGVDEAVRVGVPVGVDRGEAVPVEVAVSVGVSNAVSVGVAASVGVSVCAATKRASRLTMLTTSSA
jgi:hypothetical protein